MRCTELDFSQEVLKNYCLKLLILYGSGPSCTLYCTCTHMYICTVYTCIAIFPLERISTVNYDEKCKN